MNILPYVSACLAQPGNRNRCHWWEGQSLCDQPPCYGMSRVLGKIMYRISLAALQLLQARYGSNNGGVILLVLTAVAMFNCATVSLSVNSR